MHEDEARDVFISHLEEPGHRLEAYSTWAQPDSPMRQLIRMSGCHPQSLRLLARQMGRKGLTLAMLRDEARADLLAVLRDPLSNDTDQDRLKKVSARPAKKTWLSRSWTPYASLKLKKLLHHASAHWGLC